MTYHDTPTLQEIEHETAMAKGLTEMAIYVCEGTSDHDFTGQRINLTTVLHAVSQYLDRVHKLIDDAAGPNLKVVK